MARTKKSKDVAKFGGTESLGNVQLNGHTHEASTIEAQSKVHLEDDEGYGNAVVIRCFEFGMNPVAFKEYAPTRQELFNSHYKGIEIALWRDGLKVISEVNPRIVVDEKNSRYQIFVGARPMKGQLLKESPLTLSQIARDERYGNE